MPFRVEQLEFRALEIYETFRAFSNVVRTGLSSGLERVGRGSNYNFEQWANKVDCEDLGISAHSFGGATAVSISC